MIPLHLQVYNWQEERRKVGELEAISSQAVACSRWSGRLVDTDHVESPTDSFIWSDFLIKTVADSLVSANTMEEEQWWDWGTSEELEVKTATDFLQSPKLDVRPLVPHLLDFSITFNQNTPKTTFINVFLFVICICFSGSVPESHHKNKFEKI